ncbi:MAG: lipopolysaccharide biosynthesis protein [Clostridia bacterium]
MINLIRKWQVLSPAVKASIAFLVASVLTKGATFLSTPIFTRIMSEGEIGSVGSFLSLRGIYEVIATLSLTSLGVINVGMSKHTEEKEREGYLSAVVGFCICFSVITGIILYTIIIFFFEDIVLPKVFIFLMITHAIFTPATSFWIMKERYEFRYKKVFFVTIFQILTGQLFAIIAISIARENLDEVRLLAYAIVDYSIGLYFILNLSLKGKRFYDSRIWIDTFRFALPLIPHYLASVVLTGSDRIMIRFLISDSAAGIYTVVYGVGSIGTIIWGAIQGSITPVIYKNMNNENAANIQELSKKLIIIFGTMCFLISLLAPEVVAFLGPSSYLSGISIVPPVIGAVLVSCLYNLFSIVVFYYKKPLFIAFASIVAAIINIGLNLIFIPKYGFVAAGYTTLVSYIVLALMHYINMKKIQKINLYNCKQLFIICGFFLVLCTLSKGIYNYNFLRYILSIIIVVFLIHNRKNFMQLHAKR